MNENCLNELAESSTNTVQLRSIELIWRRKEEGSKFSLDNSKADRKKSVHSVSATLIIGNPKRKVVYIPDNKPGDLGH
jgi:hypothetical protein